ncbi:hypothetical protein ACJX0J_028627 [Zea mays]
MTFRKAREQDWEEHRATASISTKSTSQGGTEYCIFKILLSHIISQLALLPYAAPGITLAAEYMIGIILWKQKKNLQQDPKNVAIEDDRKKLSDYIEGKL